jgi:hypothetical protein
LDKYITIPFGDAGLAMESVNPGTTGVPTQTPEKKKKPKKPPTQDDIRARRDKIDDAIEKKDFATLSSGEKKRVSTGKVLVRSLRKKQKASVVAAKTMTAFALNRLHEEEQIDEIVNPIPAIKAAWKFGTKLLSKGAGAADDVAKAGTKVGDDAAKAAAKADRIKKLKGRAMTGGRKGRLKRAGLRAGGLAAAAGAGAVAAGGDSAQERPDRTIKHNHQSTLKVSVGGPEYKNNSGAVDRQRDILNRKASQAMLKEKIELDGNQFVINKNMAEKIVGVYNSLNEENKKTMINMLNDKDNQHKIFEFVTRY